MYRLLLIGIFTTIFGHTKQDRHISFLLPPSQHQVLAVTTARLPQVLVLHVITITTLNVACVV